jgi:hypothetical protein
LTTIRRKFFKLGRAMDGTLLRSFAGCGLSY